MHYNIIRSAFPGLALRALSPAIHKIVPLGTLYFRLSPCYSSLFTGLYSNIAPPELISSYLLCFGKALRDYELYSFSSRPIDMQKKETSLSAHLFFCGEDEIRTRGRKISYVSLANWWFQPLTHLSSISVLRDKVTTNFSFHQIYF